MAMTCCGSAAERFLSEFGGRLTGDAAGDEEAWGAQPGDPALKLACEDRYRSLSGSLAVMTGYLKESANQ